MGLLFGISELSELNPRLSSFYLDGDIVYDHAEGTKIQWKEGKDLSVTVETKKQRHKGTNKTRIVKKTVPAETFFNFFNPPQIPDDEEEGDDEEMQDLQERLEDDYGVGELFKLKIIPHAVDWFTGEALAYDMDDEYDEDEGYDDEDDEDEDGEVRPGTGWAGVVKTRSNFALDTPSSFFRTTMTRMRMRTKRLRRKLASSSLPRARPGTPVSTERLAEATTKDRP